MEKAGTGGGLFRRLRSKFCLEIAQLTDTPELAEAGVAVLRCADGWSALTAAGRGEATTDQRWRAVLEPARALPQLEEDGISKMAHAASVIGTQQRH